MVKKEKGNNVDSLLSQLKKEADHNNRKKEGKERVALTLSEFDVRRASYISKRLGLTRSAFLRKILIEAINDAEAFLDLEVTSNVLNDFATEMVGKPVFEYSDYGKYLYSAEEPENEGDEEDTEKD